MFGIKSESPYNQVESGIECSTKENIPNLELESNRIEGLYLYKMVGILCIGNFIFDLRGGSGRGKEQTTFTRKLQLAL